MKPEQERVQDLLKDTVTTLCRNSLQYLRGMKVQGLLGITLDDDDVFVVHINEMFQNLGADGVLIQQADSVSLGEENRCSQSGVTEESPPPINIHPAIATLNTTSPLGRNASRRKTRPSRAIGGLSEPSCTIGTISEPVGALYDNSHEPHCGLASIKQEAESIVLDDDTVEPANVSDSYNISSCDGDDDADVGLMKQSYMEEAQLNLSMEQASAVSGVHTTTTLASPIQTDATGTPFPQVLAINPQFSQGGPFIAGVAQGFTDANANTSFQLQEVDGNTVIMGMPASALSQVVEGYQESWSLPHEELGLTTRGQPRKRRMWYRPRRAGTTTPSTDQGTVMVQSCQRPRHNLGSKQQKDALRVHLVEPLVRNYLFDVVSLRVIWRINDAQQVAQAWDEIVRLRKQCDQVVSGIDGISFFISSITGAFSKPHRGKYQDVTVYPAISYWIVSEKSLDATKEFNMVSISNGILFGLANKHVIVKPINIPMAGKLGAHSQCLNAVDLLAPPLFVVMKDHTNYFTIQKVEHSAEVCGDEHRAVARFVVVDSYRFRGFLQLAVDQMVHLLPGLRLVCLERDANLPQQFIPAATAISDHLDLT